MAGGQRREATSALGWARRRGGAFSSGSLPPNRANRPAASRSIGVLASSAGAGVRSVCPRAASGGSSGIRTPYFNPNPIRFSAATI
jgi:hypothetical protein